MTSRIKAAMQSFLRATGVEVRRDLASDGTRGPMRLARVVRAPVEDRADRDALNRWFASGEKSNAVLLVSHSQAQCGVGQYGRNIARTLATSTRYNFQYVECSDINDLNRALLKFKPCAVVYNYYDSTLPWLEPKALRGYDLPELGILHEVTQQVADQATSDFFDYHIAPDPTLLENNPIVFKTPRLLPKYDGIPSHPRVPTIGSFGFGFANKGFERLIEVVQEEFDEAHIRLRLPFNDIVDKTGRNHALATAERCRAALTKPGIQLDIEHDFLPKEELLDWLASNTINAFFYTIQEERGISSTVEMAIASGRPVAVNRCNMFRHVHDAVPSICIEDNTLHQIIDNGTAPLDRYRQEWSDGEFVRAYEQILDRILSRGASYKVS